MGEAFWGVLLMTSIASTPGQFGELYQAGSVTRTAYESNCWQCNVGIGMSSIEQWKFQQQYKSDLERANREALPYVDPKNYKVYVYDK